MAHFIPLSTDTPIKEIANIFLREIWRLHGLPNSVVSDRDSRFQSKFWLCVMELLDVDVRMSTVFHPQTDGQTERVNQILEQYLRSYCSYQQDDWTELLPLGEHAYNSAVSESTKVSRLRQTMASVHVLTGWRRRSQSRSTPQAVICTKAGLRYGERCEKIWEGHKHVSGNGMT